MRKARVWIPSLLAALFLGISHFHYASRLPERISINTYGQPSVGAGDVELVVFEDLLCINCRISTENVLSKIEERYIETGKARLTLIPVAFGDDSKPLANAAIAVYKMAPDRFIPYVLGISHGDVRTKESMLELAERVGGIDIEKLSRSIDERLYYSEIDQNLVWAKRLMGEEFGTPTLFVDGVMTSTASFDDVASRIKQVEKQK
jgi:protein-disulfide isomerase